MYLLGPYVTKHINIIEKVQRYFIKYISGMQDLSYEETYFSPLYVLEHGDGKGMPCITSHNNIGRLGTLYYNSFGWHGIRLFKQLPFFYAILLYGYPKLHTVVYSLKKKSDSYLSTVPAIPCQPEFHNIQTRDTVLLITNNIMSAHIQN